MTLTMEKVLCGSRYRSGSVKVLHDRDRTKTPARALAITILEGVSYSEVGSAHEKGPCISATIVIKNSATQNIRLAAQRKMQ